MAKEKDLDKFYTHPDIAKRFVDVVNQYFPLDTFDMVIEPAVGVEIYYNIYHRVQ